MLSGPFRLEQNAVFLYHRAQDPECRTVLPRRRTGHSTSEKVNAGGFRNLFALWLRGKEFVVSANQAAQFRAVAGDEIRVRSRTPPRTCRAASRLRRYRLRNIGAAQCAVPPRCRLVNPSVRYRGVSPDPVRGRLKTDREQSSGCEESTGRKWLSNRVRYAFRVAVKPPFRTRRGPPCPTSACRRRCLCRCSAATFLRIGRRWKTGSCCRRYGPSRDPSTPRRCTGR